MGIEKCKIKKQRKGADEVKKKQYKVKDIVCAVAMSDLMRKR